MDLAAAVEFHRWSEEVGLSAETRQLLKSEGFSTIQAVTQLASGDLEVLNLDNQQREVLQNALSQLNSRGSQTSHQPTPNLSNNRPNSYTEPTPNQPQPASECKKKKGGMNKQLYPDLRGYENEFSDPEPDNSVPYHQQPITLPPYPESLVEGELITEAKREQVTNKGSDANGDEPSSPRSKEEASSGKGKKNKGKGGSKSKPVPIPTSPNLMNDYLGGTPADEEGTNPGSPMSPGSFSSAFLHKFKLTKENEKEKDDKDFEKEKGKDKEKEKKSGKDKERKIKVKIPKILKVASKREKKLSEEDDPTEVIAFLRDQIRGESQDEEPATSEQPDRKIDDNTEQKSQGQVLVEDHPLMPVDEPAVPEVKSLKDKFLDQSTLWKTGYPEVYQLPQVTISRDDETFIRHCEIATPDFPVELVVQEKVLLCVGASGAGKTTLINGLANYLLGVKWEDSFRFQIIPDKEDRTDMDSASQTQWITAYTFYVEKDMAPFKVTIIDTPGFGDTKGIDQDQELDNKIRNLFDHTKFGLDQLDAVCFCTQASETRMNAFQRYIYHRVLSIFGKDVENNIFMMVTFADAQEPKVVRLLKEHNIPFNKYFKFNNSALFASNRGVGSDQKQGTADPFSNNLDDPADSGSSDAVFNQLFWNMGTSSFQCFLEYLDNRVDPVTLSLTKEVMAKRESLQVYIVGLQENVKKGLLALDQIRQEMQVVRQHEADIARNRDFTYSVKEYYTERVDKPPGRHVTNCQQCNRTCHLNCKYANDQEKAKCSAMDSEGYCKICTPAQGGKCHWSVHFNMAYYFLFKERVVEKRAEDLFNKYKQATDRKIDAETLLAKIGDTFTNIQGEVIWQTNEIRKCLAQLGEIALKPSPLTTLDYIDQMIVAEKDTCQPGWRERVYQLENARQHAEYLQKLQDEGYDPWEEHQSQHRQAQQFADGEGNSALVSSEQTKESRLQSVTEFLHKLKSGVWGFIADEDDCHDGDADISKNSYLGGSQPDLPDVDIQPAAPDAPPAQSTSNPI
ncbi:uncharacterized protein LOC142345706 isoform X3 [Convolutriloba macropyga]